MKKKRAVGTAPIRAEGNRAHVDEKNMFHTTHGCGAAGALLCSEGQGGARLARAELRRLLGCAVVPMAAAGSCGG